MSFGTSTDSSTFRPWHLFVLAALIAGTLAVLIIRPNDPAGLIVMVLAIGAAALVGLGLYRMLWPLSVAQFSDRTEMVGQRTRAAVEREKTLVLRSIKELEFDRAMGKVSEADFHEMASRLRARAVNLIKQLDQDAPGYRDLIEQELRERLKKADRALGTGDWGAPAAAAPGPPARQPRWGGTSESAPAARAGVGPRSNQEMLRGAAAAASGGGAPRALRNAGGPDVSSPELPTTGPDEAMEVARRACADCGSSNEADAKFCKGCGRKLSE